MRSTAQLQKVKKELAESEAIEECARQCGTIGDPTKLKICYLLKHYPELNVTTIADLVGTSVSNVSHSLARLREARLVTSRREAQTIYYSLDPNAFNNVLKVIT